ncbi:Lytic transglycosylase catalytic [Chitinispirillum alkaliphilum]|nr:Lytic transglycosylase catalytic [Chitinispirillum alkaliphilum]
MGVLLSSLLLVTSRILHQELRLRELNREISQLKREEIYLSKLHGELHEKYSIMTLLNQKISFRIPPHTVHQLTEVVLTNSRQFGYDPVLLLAVIAVESSFNPHALGRYRSGTLSGALGLMQIKHSTALEIAGFLGIEDLAPEDLFDPEINLVIGTAYLTRLISQFQSFKLGLLAYNQGQGTIRRTLFRREPLYIRYYEKVLKHYFEMRELLDNKAPLNVFTEEEE